MKEGFEGGCGCRAVRYKTTSDPLMAVHCHCRDCQYASGGAGATAVVVPRDSFTLEGSTTTYRVAAASGAEVTRHFCATCGTHVFAVTAAAPAFFSIKAATLDDPSIVAPAAHIWTSSAPPWVTFTDGLPTFEKNFGE